MRRTKLSSKARPIVKAAEPSTEARSRVALGTQAVRTNQDYVRAAVLQWWRLWTMPWRIFPVREPARAMALPVAAAPAESARASARKRAASKRVKARRPKTAARRRR